MVETRSLKVSMLGDSTMDSGSSYAAVYLLSSQLVVSFHSLCRTHIKHGLIVMMALGLEPCENRTKYLSIGSDNINASLSCFSQPL